MVPLSGQESGQEKSQKESLEIMRNKILKGSLNTAIFTEGMEEIIDEYDLFKNFHKTKPVYVI